jgi:hypothetical protein
MRSERLETKEELLKQITQFELPENLVLTATRILQNVYSHDPLLPLPVVALVDKETLAIEWIQEGVFIDLQEKVLELDLFENRSLSQHCSTEYPLPEKLDDVLEILIAVLPGRMVYVVTCF